MKRDTIRGVRIIREPDPAPEMPYSVDHFDAGGNLIAELGRYPDLASGRQATPLCDTGRSATCVSAIERR